MSKSFECPVCYRTRNEQVLLECGHIFCKKCIKEWSNKNKLNKVVSTCPMCRSILKKKRLEHRILHRDKGLSKIMTLIGF